MSRAVPTHIKSAGSRATSQPPLATGSNLLFVHTSALDNHSFWRGPHSEHFPSERTLAYTENLFLAIVFL